MKTLVFFAFLGLTAAAPTSDDDKIIGGYECPKHSTPWIVSLNIGYHLCGGSLISENWVVSAAHCYQRHMWVMLGKHDIMAVEETEQLIESEVVLRHSLYNSDTLDYDIMLIKLSQPAVLNRNVAAIPLPTQCPMAGDECLISGWGNTKDPGADYGDRLQCLKAPIVSQTLCKKSYMEVITNNMICLGFLEGGKDSCQGDSGGPVVCDGVLQGVVSWGYGCAERFYRGVNTRVCNFVSWIEETMAAN
ncbi:trypsin-like isoform X1 [Mobula hypostoma]|uniref:trypsin-like isoform X1 n=1 Tax=Mobula hypostoma TaxID=723540 RepID=UPI002FC28A41